MDGSRRVFRSSLRVLWRWTTIFCFVVSIGTYFITPLPPARTASLSLVIGGVFAIAVVSFPIYVLPHGIRCYNYYGFYSTVRWDSISRIRQRSVFGLRYLVVRSPSSWSEIYIPLYLSDMQGFIAAVRERAGENHPLVTALQG